MDNSIARRAGAALAALGLGLAAADAGAFEPSIDIRGTSLFELMNLRITSVSKTEEALSDAPAAVHVITREEIRHAGVTSIPEALRLAPGVHVARRGSSGWVIAIRGLNGDVTNKLLVLIDGRSVYSPLYAGVFWDVQDVLLEDIDRIEVVAGPGGPLWGANAVNGVINIITRPAAATQGGFAEFGGGNEERAYAGLRYGTRLGERTALRAYVKAFDRDAASRADGRPTADDWHMAQTGFRVDTQSGPHDQLTLQGDLYHGKKGLLQRPPFTFGTLPGPDVPGRGELAGGNLLGRWQRAHSGGGSLRLQAYIDHTRRDLPGTLAETRHTFDLDFQHQSRPAARHELLWGLGYRMTRDRLRNGFATAFLPARRQEDTFSLFVQDKIDLHDARLFLTLGGKFEHNDYTGFEHQPNVRLSWRASERQTLWAAASRAIRIPSRFDSDVRLVFPAQGQPIRYFVIEGNPAIDSEELIAYEAGYRAQPLPNLSFDLALFHNEYDNLISNETSATFAMNQAPRAYVVIPSRLDNLTRGTGSGASLTTTWQPTSDWRLQLQYARLDLGLHAAPTSNFTMAGTVAGRSPREQWSLFSFAELAHSLRLYVGLRHVGALRTGAVPGYTALDLSLAWQWRDDLALALTGTNLTDRSHVEFPPLVGVEAERSIHAKLTWRF